MTQPPMSAKSNLPGSVTSREALRVAVMALCKEIFGDEDRESWQSFPEMSKEYLIKCRTKLEELAEKQ